MLSPRLIAANALARLKNIGEFPRSAPSPVRAAFWLFLAFAAAFLVYPQGWLYPADGFHLLSIIEHLGAIGKPLLYGLPLPRDMAMPLMGVASLVVGNMDPAGAQILWLLLSALLCLSAYGLGCLLSGRVAGVVASAAMFSGQTYSGLFFDIEQRFYCLFLVLVANALALAWLSPLARRLVVGLSIGVSFLARSALCFLPVLLALPELARIKRDGWGAALRSTVLVLVVPFLFLLPWNKLNFASGKEFMLFDGRGDWNVVTGAMGMVSTFEGDYRKLAGMRNDESAGLWAAKRIVSHPVVYASGVMKRAGLVIRKHPLIIPCWVLSVILLWRRENFRRVNLLGLYFIGLHLAFSTEERYFVAILPLLAAIAGASVFALAGEDESARREGSIFSAASALPPAILGVFCMFLLLFHTGQVSEARKEAVFAQAPASADAWLLREQGRFKLLKGDYPGAYSSLGKAATLVPADVPAKLDLATAAFLKNRRGGRPSGGADLVNKLPLGSAGWFHYRPGKEYVLKALCELDSGQAGKAAQSAELARRARGGFIHFKLKTDGAAMGEEKARAADTYVEDIVFPELLVYFPVDLRDRLGPEFLRLYKKGARAVDVEKSWEKITAEPAMQKTGYLAEQSRPGALSEKNTGGGLPEIYDPKRDPGTDIQTALKLARSKNKRVFVIIGGDWCNWCATMSRFFADNPDIEKIREQNFILLKIHYNPARPPLPEAISKYPKIAGYPHIYILDADGTVLESKDTTQLELNSGYDREKFAAFLQHWEKR